MGKFKIHDLVKLNKFPHEVDVFIIVGNKENPWLKPLSSIPGGEVIKVEMGKDYILTKKRDDKFGTFGISENGIHVIENEIKLI
jgi:hypothetical protein